MIIDLILFAPQKSQGSKESAGTVEPQDVGREFGHAATPQGVLALLPKLAIYVRTHAFYNAPAPSVGEGVPGDLAAHYIAGPRGRLRRSLLDSAAPVGGEYLEDLVG